MSDLILAFAVVFSNVVFFLFGMRIGEQKRGAEPPPDAAPPVPEVTEKEQKAIETMLRNIDVYDGTGLGQEDVL